MSIYDINYFLIIKKLENINHNINITDEGFLTIAHHDMKNIPKLPSNKTSVLSITNAVIEYDDYIIFTEIIISIKYRLFPHFPSFTENFHFKTERKNNGEYIWVEDYAAK